VGVCERHSKSRYKHYNLLNKSLHGLWCNECACLQRGANRNTYSNADADTNAYYHTCGDTYSNSDADGYSDTYGYTDTYAYSYSCTSD